MKKSLSLVVAVMMLVFLLAACGGGNNKNTDASASPSPATESKQKSESQSGSETATLQFWHSLTGRNAEFLDAMLKRFNDTHPHIQVQGTFQGNYDETVTKLQQAIPSGTGPDLAMLERAYVEMFADAEVLEDLNPYLQKSGMSMDDFAPGLMGHSVFGDKLVSLPLNRSTPIMHVNKTMLDEHGLAVPTTWEELMNVANALIVKEGNEFKRYGFSMPYDTWYPIAMITQAGGTFYNEDRTSIGFFDNGVGEKVFGFLKEAQNSGALYYPPAKDSASIVNGMFVEGKIGILYQSTGTIGSMMQNVKFDYVTAFLPKDQVFSNPTGGANIAMLAGSKNKDAAWEFTNWLMNEPEGALQFVLDTGYLPFTKKMADSQQLKDLWAKEPNRKVAYDQLQYAVDTNKSVAWPETMHEFFAAIEAIMYDSKDIKSTLETFKKEAERILAQ